MAYEETESEQGNIQLLLSLYRAGRRPPLDKLVEPDLLKVFQRGVIGKKLRSFGILMPAQDQPENSDDRWVHGEFINLKFHWQEHCRVLREWVDTTGWVVFEQKCDDSDRHYAAIAAREGIPIVYLCHGGMVDHALPIIVDGRTIAVMFAGQVPPASGKKWAHDLIHNYVTRDKVAGTYDASEESKRRKQKIMERMKGASSIVKPPDIVALANLVPKVEPEDIPQILDEMQTIANELSHLAKRTIDYELGALRAYFTSQVARLVSKSDDEFWGGFALFLHEFAEFCDEQYAVLYLLRRPTDEVMEARTPVPGELRGKSEARIWRRSFVAAGRYKPFEPVRLSPQSDKEKGLGGIDLAGWPYYAIPLEVDGPLGVIVLGRTDATRMRDLSEAECRFIREVFHDISIMLENRRQLQARDIYVMDLRHEVKSPLAAVLAAAENMAEGRIPVEEMPARAQDVLKRLRRLQMNVDRFRMLEKLLSSHEAFQRGRISLAEVAKECQGEYQKLALDRNMTITVSKELGSLPMLYTNRDALKHALGNLLDNAIKYGEWGTGVVVEGRQTRSEVKIDVGDIGIGISEHEKNYLGNRYFRTKSARKRDPAGTGIGLTFVDRFLKVNGGRREVQSLPRDAGNHHVIISLFLPR